MSIKNKRLIIAISFIVILMLFVSCCFLEEKVFTKEFVTDLYERTQSASIQYGEEPIPGNPATLFASFDLTNKTIIITRPPFEGFAPEIPFDAYSKHSFCNYSWYTDNPEDIYYVILLEPYITPEGDFKTKNSLLYTIVDLSSGEKIFKDIIVGDPNEITFPYDTLAQTLESFSLK